MPGAPSSFLFLVVKPQGFMIFHLKISRSHPITRTGSVSGICVWPRFPRKVAEDRAAMLGIMTPEERTSTFSLSNSWNMFLFYRYRSTSFLAPATEHVDDFSLADFCTLFSAPSWRPPFQVRLLACRRQTTVNRRARFGPPGLPGWRGSLALLGLGCALLRAFGL